MSGGGKGKITVLVPVYECAERFAAHLPSVRALRQVGMELVWVVTASRDGSDRLVRQAHAELGGQFLEVPPGLYEAWNAGIREITTEYVYISTVGEEISPAALEEVRLLLDSRQADVCFTPPKLPPAGEARRQILRWPIFRFQRELKQREGNILSPFFIARIQAISGIFSLLGSCASCLFRTRFLQGHPFSSGYHHYGDSAWVYQNYATARMVYRGEPIAGFAIHGPSGRTIGPRDVERLRRIILRDLRGKPESRQAIRALSRLGAASRYLDFKRGRRPSRLWWLKLKLAKARLERSRWEKRLARELTMLERQAAFSRPQTFFK